MGPLLVLDGDHYAEWHEIDPASDVASPDTSLQYPLGLDDKI